MHLESFDIARQKFAGVQNDPQGGKNSVVETPFESTVEENGNKIIVLTKEELENQESGLKGVKRFDGKGIMVY